MPHTSPHPPPLPGSFTTWPYYKSLFRQTVPPPGPQKWIACDFKSHAIIRYGQWAQNQTSWGWECFRRPPCLVLPYLLSTWEPDLLILPCGHFTSPTYIVENSESSWLLGSTFVFNFWQHFYGANNGVKPFPTTLFSTWGGGRSGTHMTQTGEENCHTSGVLLNW
jgi:hypothetical protein